MKQKDVNDSEDVNFVFGDADSDDESSSDPAYSPMSDGSDDDDEIFAAAVDLNLHKNDAELPIENVGCSSKSKPKWRAYNAKPKEVSEPAQFERGCNDPINEVSEEDEGYHTDELHNLKGSDDDEAVESKPAEFNEGAQYGQVNLQLEMLFPNLTIFKQAVKDYTVALGRPVKIVKNDKVRCRMKCVEDCPWEIFCSWCEGYGSYQIKSFNPNHTCSRKLKNPVADKKWVARKLVERLRSTPNMTAADAYNFMADSYQVQLGEMKLYRAMHIARQMVEGTEKEQYAKLWDYCAEIRRSNPRSTLQLGIERPSLDFPPRFDRLYICFEACKRGAIFGCRPLIGLDGCFLKGYYGGTLLAAVTQDANQSFFVIAYAIVDQETKDSWTWFLVRLFEDIGHPSTHGWEFISDMQKGLLPAIQDLSPGASHRFCVKHLEANVWKQWRNTELRSKLWGCAKSKTMPEFEKNYQELKSMNEAAWSYLNRFPPHTWTRAAFKTGTRNWALLNNMCEQFNATIVKFRGKPILTMLEEIRTYLMNKMNNSRNLMAKYKGPIAPAAQSKLEQAKKDSNSWNPLWAGDEDGCKFQVQHILRFTDKHSVDLKEFTCSCREWDLTGIPCAHAVACLGHNNLVPEHYVNALYSRETWETTYRPYIAPLRGQDQWDKTGQEPVLPPNYTRGGGRPKKQRTKTNDVPENPFKAKRKYGPLKCGKCGSQGHNSRRCQGTTTKDTKAKKQKTSAKDKGKSIEGAGRESTQLPTPAQEQSGSFTDMLGATTISNPTFFSSPITNSGPLPMSSPNSALNIGPLMVPTPSVQTKDQGVKNWTYGYGIAPSTPHLAAYMNRTATRPPPRRPLIHSSHVSPQVQVPQLRCPIAAPVPSPPSPNTPAGITPAPFPWRGQQCVTRERLLAANTLTRSNRVSRETMLGATRLTRSRFAKLASSSEGSSSTFNQDLPTQTSTCGDPKSKDHNRRS